jgi:hypothetical protein
MKYIPETDKPFGIFESIFGLIAVLLCFIIILSMKIPLLYIDKR